MELVRRALPGLAEQTASAGGQLVGGSLPIGGGRGGRREEHGGQVRYRAGASRHQDYIGRPHDGYKICEHYGEAPETRHTAA